MSILKRTAEGASIGGVAGFLLGLPALILLFENDAPDATTPAYVVGLSIFISLIYYGVIVGAAAGAATETIKFYYPRFFNRANEPTNDHQLPQEINRVLNT